MALDTTLAPPPMNAGMTSAAPQAAQGAQQAPAPGQDMLKNLMSTLTHPRSHAMIPAPHPEDTKTKFGGIYGLVQKFSQQAKEKQIRASTADFEALGNAWDKAGDLAFDPKTGQPDPQKQQQVFAQLAEPILGDPKKMKNISKAFAMDWLNPEKQTVQGEGMKRWAKSQEASKSIKILRALHIAKKQAEPQLDPNERKQMAGQEAEQFGKFNTSQAATDPKDAIEAAKAAQTAQKDAQEAEAKKQELAQKVAQNQAEQQHWKAIETQNAAQLKFHETEATEKARHDKAMETIAAKKSEAGGGAHLFTEYESASKQLAPLRRTAEVAQRADGFIKDPTGPGDVALLSTFVEVTKPQTGFRWTQQEVNMIKGSRGLVEGAQNRVQSGYTGVLFGDKDSKQRKMIGDIVKAAGQRAERKKALMIHSLDKINPDLGSLIKDEEQDAPADSLDNILDDVLGKK